MRFFIIFLLVTMIQACNKVVQVDLPEYASEMVVEMYLENGKPLRCLLSESLPYTNSLISDPLENATVVFSDGIENDTLFHERVDDWESGRWYNYAHPRKVIADPSTTYTLKITDEKGRTISGSTRFLQKLIKIDSVDIRPSQNNADSLKVGVLISDPAGTENYYRFLITKNLYDFSSDITDIYLSDASFNGKKFSFFSEESYSRGDTILVRVYSLQKEHYDYIKSANDARVANFNPFVQPALIKSSISGGRGIFTAVVYDERRIPIR